MIDETEIKWELLGECRGAPSVNFFPDRGGAGCDVRLECLDYAMRNHENYGIWGGKSERQRRVLRRKWRPTMTLGELSRLAREQGDSKPGRKPRAA